MKRGLTFAAIALSILVVGGRSHAGTGGPEVGDKAPDFEGKEFVNGEECSLKSLRGQVVYFEIFRTWCGPCNAQAPHMTELHEKYGSKGLRVIGITNEGRAVVDKFVEKHSAKHMIVVESSNSGANYDATGVPSPWLIGADGRILVKGLASDAQIEEALQKVRMAPTLPKTLATFETPIRKERFGEVRGKVTKLLEGTTLTEDDRKAATELVAWIDWQAESAMGDAKADAEKGDWYEASVTLERTKRCFPGLPAAADATEQLKQIAADKAKKDAVAAGKKLQATLDLQREKGLSPKEAIPLFKQIASKYDGTPAGKRAAAVVKSLQADIDKKG